MYSALDLSLEHTHGQSEVWINQFIIVNMNFIPKCPYLLKDIYFPTVLFVFVYVIVIKNKRYQNRFCRF